VSAAFSDYLAERFPVAPYLVLIGAMVLGATAAACDGAGYPVQVGWEQLVVVVVLLLAFFHLRVFDEHKDYERDCLAHPERVLSTGRVTLRQLRQAAGAAITAQLLLAWGLGSTAFAYLILVLGFSVLMRYEFFVGSWLNRHIVLYALSHNPIVALMMVFSVTVTLQPMGGLDWSQEVIAYLLLASLTSLGFEVGRKLRAPEDELEGQDTYTAALGVARAVGFLSLVMVLSLLSAWSLLEFWWTLGGATAVVALALSCAYRFVQTPTVAAAKACENITTLAALGLYILVVVDVALRRGWAWI